MSLRFGLQREGRRLRRYSKNIYMRMKPCLGKTIWDTVASLITLLHPNLVFLELERCSGVIWWSSKQHQTVYMNWHKFLNDCSNKCLQLFDKQWSVISYVFTFEWITAECKYTLAAIKIFHKWQMIVSYTYTISHWMKGWRSQRLLMFVWSSLRVCKDLYVLSGRFWGPVAPQVEQVVKASSNKVLCIAAQCHHCVKGCNKL